jgi:DNA-binding CsgD family transcriptional regulator
MQRQSPYQPTDGVTSHSDILKGWLRNFSSFGLWTMHVWIFWLNTNSRRLITADGSAWHMTYLAQSLVMLAVALFAFRWTGRSEPHSSRLPILGVDIAVAIAGLLATCLYGGSLFGFALPEALSMASILLCGVCLGITYLRWGVFYATLSLKAAIRAIFAACIIGAIIKALLAVVDNYVGLAVALCLPVLSTVFLRVSLAADIRLQPSELNRHPAQRYFNRNSAMSLLKIAVCVGVYSFIFAFISGFSQVYMNALPHISQIGHLIEVTVSLFVLWFVLVKSRAVSFAQLWRCVMVLIGIMLILGAFSETASLQAICSTCISYFVVVFLWLLLSDIAQHSDFHPCFIFGVGWVFYALPNGLGHLLATGIAISFSITPQIALLLLFGVMLSTLLLESRDLTIQRIFNDLNDVAPLPTDFALIDERGKALGEQFGLTAREVEVLQLLSKGRSKAYIAETLFISENTVRGHSRRLYVKLGVHSRRELQQLIGI